MRCAALALLSIIALYASADGAPRRLTLGDAIDTALQRSPVYTALANDLELARLELERARDAFRTRFTSRMNSSDRTGAELGSTYEIGLSRQMQSGSSMGLGFATSSFGDTSLSELKVAYSLPLFGNPAVASRYALDSAEIETGRREQILAMGADELAARVIGDYYETVLATNRHSVAQSGRDLAEALVQVTAVRERAGTSSALDGRRARLNVAEATQRLRSSGLGVERARQRLAALIGLPIDFAFIVDDEIPAIEHTATHLDPKRVEARALARRPELVGMRQELELLSRRAGDAAAALPPIEVSLQWSLVGEGGNAGDSFALDEPRFGIGVNVALDRGRAQSYERRRWALQYETRRQSYIALENRVRFDVRDALLALDDALAGARIAEQQLALATDEFRVAELRYRSGSATTEEVLRVEQSLADAQLIELERRVAYWIARRRVDRLSGIGAEQWHTFAH
jgi:outer membrane protein TolC